MSRKPLIQPNKVHTIFDDVSSISLQEILRLCKQAEIDPKDFDKVIVRGSYDSEVFCNAVFPKTQQEIEEETKKAEEDRFRRRIAYEKGRETRIQRQLEKAQKQQKKLEILKTLTKEQREALGL